VANKRTYYFERSRETSWAFGVARPFVLTATDEIIIILIIILCYAPSVFTCIVGGAIQMTFTFTKLM